MFERLRNSKLMFWSLELLIIASLIFVSTKIDFVFQPFFTFFSTLFSPILIAGFLYYMLNPLVELLQEKAKLSKNLSVAAVLLFFIGMFIFFVSLIIPNLIKQMGQLIQNLPQFIKAVEDWTGQLFSHPLVKDLDVQSYLDKMDLSLGAIVRKVINGVSSGLGSFVGVFANVTIVAVTVPFMLFYMLKDGDRLVPMIEKYLPAQSKDEILMLLHKMSQTISKYISGQAIECTFVAVGTMIGYKIIGVEYAFLFGIIAGITNMIPYVGPYLGLAPALFVTLFSGHEKALLHAALACVVVLIVQQIDGNIIYPNVIGKSLDIHPLTIIIILLVAGNIAGLLGMILGVPFYAVCKTVFIHVYDMVQVRQRRELLSQKEPAKTLEKIEK
ncbi:AI-2E family transporter [Vagococcus lutrae]|uniref:AI-2E family transporter n=1 Tax=Vagococcus lutrae TaxID=81947 RepID=UPI00200D7E8D|nr:AI-2E family transporter [Vagococcus lutrae]MDT2805837.1 AI-2E family transporter [Vagococcus lutrae]MDY3705350.1 AI-2E family transporter [Vagococcus lutrae]UQF71474.1 AI-2E family transporter [Vagococcus lutrae]